MSTRKAKRVWSLLLAVCMLLITVPLVSSAADAGDTFTAGDFTYKVNTDTSTVTLTAIAAAALTGEVTVPGTVSDGENDYTVTQLGDAFKNQGTKTNGMTGLVLPDSITKFTGTATFYGCKFTSIHLPANLTGDATTGQLTNTFMYCNSLTSVVLPAGITKCYGSFRNSGVRTVSISGMSQVDFYGGSGTTDARAWVDNTTGITIYYPANGTAPTRTGTSFTATVVKLQTQGTQLRYGDFVYTINSNTATVTLTSISAAVSALPASVTVPSTITDPLGGSYTVTQLGDAFKNKESVTKSMTSLTLPDTITKFTGTATFYACKGLTSIHLPVNLTGDATNKQLTSTFMYCNALASVTLPAGITQCYGTFRNSAVKSVTITGTSAVSFYADSGTEGARAWSNSVTGITIYYPANGTAPTRYSSSYFSATISPIAITFTSGNFKYKVNSDGNSVTLTGAADGVTLSGEVPVPSSVTYEGDPYTVTAIGGQAFNGKTAVTALTIPNTITTLGYQAFMEMDGLTSFTMPDSVTTIGYGLFYGCSNLEDVKLSKNLTGTMQTTFAYCAKLRSCVIPSGVTTLNKTFMYCNIIKTVFVPASVTNITGDDNADIRNRLFSTFNVEETITGAPTEPGFAVLGEDNTMIATYIRGAGWNFEVVDTSLPLAIGIPTPRVDDTATPAREYVSLDLLNIGKSDQTSNKSVYVAYYSKENDKLVDLAMVRRSSTEAISSERLEFELDTEYSAEDVYVRAFTWEDSSMTNLAGFTEYYEIEEN